MHASMYIPLSLPPTQLPQYVHLDRNSQWHTSALLSAALESATLPTRLRHDTQERGFVDDLEAALNVNGKQRVAQLQCSILDPENVVSITHGSIDDRAPSGNRPILAEEDGRKLTEPRLDMNLSNHNARSAFPFATQHAVLDHVFGAVENQRTKIQVAKGDETGRNEIMYAKGQGRFAGLPVIERFVTPILSRILPLPRILPYPSNPVQISLLA